MALGQPHGFAQRFSPRQPGGDGGGIGASRSVQSHAFDPRRGQHPLAFRGTEEVHCFLPVRQVAALDRAPRSRTIEKWTRAARRSSSGVRILFPVKTSASNRLGVTSAARGNRSRRRIPSASRDRSRRPLVAIITGSTTRGTPGYCRKKRATSRTIAADHNSPVLAAAGGDQEKTASICARTILGEHGSTREMARGFCAVTQVMALAPCTSSAAKVFRSA